MVDEADITRWPEDDAPESHRDGDIKYAYVDPEPAGFDDAPEDDAPEAQSVGSAV